MAPPQKHLEGDWTLSITFKVDKSDSLLPVEKLETASGFLLVQEMTLEVQHCPVVSRDAPPSSHKTLAKVNPIRLFSTEKTKAFSAFLCFSDKTATTAASARVSLAAAIFFLLTVTSPFSSSVVF